MMSFPVLVVDDDAGVTKALDRALALRFDVTIANSGSVALERLTDQETYPVIVTDLRMPEMDGIEFISAAQKVSSDSVFVVLTGSQDAGAEDYINQAGTVFKTIWKPAKKVALVEAIETAYQEFQRRYRQT